LTAANNLTVTRTQYGGPAPDREFLYYEIVGGGHVWPSGPEQGLQASEEIWRFFSRYVGE